MRHHAEQLLHDSPQPARSVRQQLMQPADAVAVVGQSAPVVVSHAAAVRRDDASYCLGLYCARILIYTLLGNKGGYGLLLGSKL